MKQRRILSIAAGCLLSAAGAIAQTADSSGKTIGFSAAGALEGGQIVKGRYLGVDLLHRIWLGRTVADLNVHATVRNRFRGSVTLEGELWFNTFAQENNKDFITPLRPYARLIIREAQGCYSFFGLDRPMLTLSAGAFPFKYNPDARNLGEYLFRSGGYPGYLITNFDDPRAIMTGIRLGSELLKSLRQDLILSTEREILPYHDFSLSYVAGYGPSKGLDFGAGVCLDRLISVNPAYTDPKSPDNRYVNAAGDTLYYTFRGVKLMGRFSFDPKPLLGSAGRIFGPNDLRLYCEAAILGVKNHHNTDTTLNPNDYYGDILKRIPVMAGINIPTFKLLDVLSLEVEWYGSEYPNTYYRLMRNDGSILPIPGVRSSGARDYKADNWKWSVYARRTFLNSFSITAQIADDHLRHRIFNELYNDEEELLRLPGDWYWMLKLSMSI